MNETDWLRGRDPEVMLAAVGGRMTPRKWVLLQCAVARRIVEQLPSHFPREFIDRYELDWKASPETFTLEAGTTPDMDPDFEGFPERFHGDFTGRISRINPISREVEQMIRRRSERLESSRTAALTFFDPFPDPRDPERFGHIAVWHRCRLGLSSPPFEMIYAEAYDLAARKLRNIASKNSQRIFRHDAATWCGEEIRKVQKDLVRSMNAAMRNYSKPAKDLLHHFLHEQFGNPYRPNAFDPSWRTGDVLALATGIEAGRAFDRMPILADALEEAGCTDAAMLTHLRDEVEHQRGCWVLDAILERDPEAFPPEPLVETTGDHGRTEPLGLAYPGRMEV